MKHRIIIGTFFHPEAIATQLEAGNFLVFQRLDKFEVLVPRLFIPLDFFNAVNREPFWKGVYLTAEGAKELIEKGPKKILEELLQQERNTGNEVPVSQIRPLPRDCGFSYSLNEAIMEAEKELIKGFTDEDLARFKERLSSKNCSPHDIVALVKEYRDLTNASLKEANDFVTSIKV